MENHAAVYTTHIISIINMQQHVYINSHFIFFPSSSVFCMRTLLQSKITVLLFNKSPGQMGAV